MNPPALLRMTAPLREDFTIPYHDIGDRAQTPKLALVAGIHGDELNGIFVLSRLANFLHAVNTGGHAGQRLTARVIIIPAVNLLGVNIGSRRWPFDGTDINRMFPGYDAGETTQRIAHAVLTLTRPAHYRVDIHSSNSHFEECPQVRLYEPTAAERLTARWFGLPAVIELRMNKVFTSTLGYAWRTCGGENFVIQGGIATVLDAAHCERLFRALVAFLSRSGILQGKQLSAEDEDVHHFGIGQTVPLISERAGLFVSRLAVGRWVQAGDVIGMVYDGFDGELRHEVRAPAAGLLSGLRRQALLFEGDLIARIQSRHSPGEGVDTYLHGQGQ